MRKGSHHWTCYQCGKRHDTTALWGTRNALRCACGIGFEYATMPAGEVCTITYTGERPPRDDDHQ